MNRHPKTEPMYRRLAELDFQNGDVPEPALPTYR